MVRQAPVICVMAPPIHLGAWLMALMLWLPFELLLMKGDRGMANYEKQVEQEAAYPIRIYL